MDLKIATLSEVSHREREKYPLYVESTKMIQMNLFTKQKQTYRLREQTYDYQRGKGQGKG